MSLMLLIAAAIIAFTSNLDNFGFGLAYGIRSINISLIPNSIIALLTMLATGLSMYLGSKITQIMPVTIISICGGIVIAGIGLFTALRVTCDKRIIALFQRTKTSNQTRQLIQGLMGAKPGNGSIISIRGAAIAGLALSGNNLLTGVVSGASGVPPGVTTILVGIFSLICVGGGSRLGSITSVRLFNKVAPLVAGMLLVIVGVKISIA